MGKLLVVAALLAVSITACKKTESGDLEVEKPVVGTVTDTVNVPKVEVGTDTTNVTVPAVEVKKDTVKVHDVYKEGKINNIAGFKAFLQKPLKS